MSLFLPKLSSKKDIDEVIKGVAEKVVVLRFGRDEDSVCLQLDEIVSSTDMTLIELSSFKTYSLSFSFANFSCQKPPMT